MSLGGKGLMTCTADHTFLGDEMANNKMRRECKTYGDRRGLWTVLLEKPEENISLERPRQWWENNIKIHLQEMGCGIMDWNELARDRDSWRALVIAVMNLRIP
jgi:hypothetical protein